MEFQRVLNASCSGQVRAGSVSLNTGFLSFVDKQMVVLPASWVSELLKDLATKYQPSHPEKGDAQFQSIREVNGNRVERHNDICTPEWIRSCGVAGWDELFSCCGKIKRWSVCRRYST